MSVAVDATQKTDVKTSNLVHFIKFTILSALICYASDNPLLSGETLASGPMGDEGIRPTGMITKIIAVN